MLVRDVLRAPAPTVRADATVAEAARVITSANVSCCVVLDGAAAVGIVTERDLARKVLAEGRPATTPVRVVMSRPLRTIDVEATIELAAEEMGRERIRHLVAIRGGEIVGIVSATDIAVALPGIERDLAAHLANPWQD